MPKPWIGVPLAVLIFIATPARAQWGFFFGRQGGYALDDVRRVGVAPDALCAPSTMVRYRGTTLRLSGTVRVHPAFAARLPEMERVIAEVATEIYGRAPSRILHAGAYNCRAVRGNQGRVSEHALGNALDVSGFVFPAVRRRAPVPEDLPRPLRRGFTVGLAQHWQGEGDVRGRHARFLRALVDRLVREDVFRVIYGPRHPGHTGHFHFDMSPFRWIHV